VTTIDSAKIDAFARLMTEKLDNGDTNARRSYIRSIIDAIEVDDKAIRIIGSKDVLQAVVAGKQTANGNVRGFVRKWRAPETIRTSELCRRSLPPYSIEQDRACCSAIAALNRAICLPVLPNHAKNPCSTSTFSRRAWRR
jgi:hypothetical protein